MENANVVADIDVDQKGASEEVNYFTRVSKEVKRTVFRVTYHLLREEQFSFCVKCVFLIIELLQFIHFSFKAPLTVLWKQPELSNLIFRISGYTMILPNLLNSTWELYQLTFFICVGIIGIVVVLIIYVVIALQQKNVSINWPVSLLRIVAESINHVFFLPFLELFMSVFHCRQMKVGKVDHMMHAIYSNVICYEGNYITQILVGAILSLLLCLFSGLFALIYYECRYRTGYCSNRTSSRGEFLFFTFKIILVFFFTFVVGQGTITGTDSDSADFSSNNNSQYSIVFIILITSLSIILFDYYSFNLQYINHLMGRFITIQHAIGTWTALMLILAKITENGQFDAAPEMWLLGIPFIVFIVIMRSNEKYQYLLQNSNNYESLHLALNELQYLTNLLGVYKTDRSVAVMLDGFLDFHRSQCNKEECPSKRRIMKTTKFSKQMRQAGESETLITLIATIQQMYYHGLQKFPNSTRLRILYALYLLDKTNSKQQALQELLNAEREGPAFDEQFIIYRYKIIIENELMESNANAQVTKGEIEIVNELSIQNHMQSCRQNVEGSAGLHVEFWTQLQEEQPDLGKLSELGFKISIVNQMAEDQWNKLIRINPNMPSMMRLYAKFLIQILNDRESGEQIIQRMLDLTQRGTAAGGASKKSVGIIDMSSESKPTIFISAEDDSFGLITNANIQAAAILCYSKMELLNRNVKVIMPQLYSKCHDFFLENYLSTLEPRILNQERTLPAKNKHDYIFPIQMEVRHVPSLIHGLQFVGQFRLIKTLLQTCYLLINNQGQIENLSTSCINLIGVEHRKLIKKKLNIIDIIPNFYEKIQMIMSKAGTVVQVQSKRGKSKSFSAIVHATEISFRNIGQQGLFIKIEKMKVNSTAHSNNNGKQRHNDDEGENNDAGGGYNDDNDQHQKQQQPLNTEEPNNNNNSTILLHQSLDQSQMVLPQQQYKLINKSKQQPTISFMFKYDINSKGYMGEFYENVSLINASMAADDPDNSYANILFQMNNQANPIIQQSYQLLQQQQGTAQILNTPKSNDNSHGQHQHQHHPHQQPYVLMVNQQPLQNQQRRPSLTPGSSSTNAVGFTGGTNFGAGIRQVRLIGEKLIDLEEFKKEDDADDDDLEEQKEYYGKRKDKNGEDMFSDENFSGLNDGSNIFRRRAAFLNFLKKSNFLNVKSIKNLKIYSILFILLAISLCLVNYFIINAELVEGSQRYSLLVANNKLIACEQTILSKMQELESINLGLISNEDLSQTIYPKRRNDMSQSLTIIETLQNNLLLTQLAMSNKQSVMNSNRSVPMHFYENGQKRVINFDINEATQQLISKVHLLINSPIGSYLSNNSDYFFVQFNLLNSLYTAHGLISAQYLNELQMWVSTKHTILINLIIVASTISLLGAVFLVPFFVLVNHAQQEVLTLFLDIPLPKVKRIFMTCNRFLNHMQSGNDEDLCSDNSEGGGNGEGAEDDSLINSRFCDDKRRKKFKINLKNKKNFFIPFALSALVFEGFFVLTFILAQDISDKFSIFIKELNSTSIAENYFSFTNNALRQLFLNKSFPILEGQSSYTYLNQSIDTMYWLVSGIQKEHSINIEHHNQIYIQAYDDMMMDGKVCDLLSEIRQASTALCLEFMQGSLQQGMSVAMPRHIENIRQGIIKYEKITDQINDLVGQPLMNDSITIEIQTMQDSYIRPVFRYLVDKFIESIDSDYTSSTAARVTLLIITIILLVLFYLFLWMPVISSISREVIRIRSMISMIPMDICASNRSIRTMLQSYITKYYEKD